MKNPALAILWLVPIVTLIVAAAILVAAEVGYGNLDAEKVRENMHTIAGTYQGLPSVGEIEDQAWAKLLGSRTLSFSVAASGVGAVLLPLTVTAVGRSQKNAAREVTASLRELQRTLQPPAA